MPKKRHGLSVLELCSGAGGQALGFEAAGFNHVALIDNDPHACATLRMNRPYWNVIEADLLRFSASNWKGVDVVAAGLPCPPFSIAGRQHGADDDRNLFPAFIRVVSETSPLAVVVENVRGLLLRRFDEFRNDVVNELANLGYECCWQLLNAVNYGTPQFRTRSFLVALRQHSSFEWPNPSNEVTTVGEAIGEMMALNGWKRVKSWVRQANQPAPTLVGGSNKHGGPDLGPTRARREWLKLGVDGLGIADEPPGKDFEGLPRLTVPMTARLQTFPDDWKFAGGKTRKYRQVGNALPMTMSKAVANQVAKCLEK